MDSLGVCALIGSMMIMILVLTVYSSLRGQLAAHETLMLSFLSGNDKTRFNISAVRKNMDVEKELPSEAGMYDFDSAPMPIYPNWNSDIQQTEKAFQFLLIIIRHANFTPSSLTGLFSLAIADDMVLRIVTLLDTWTEDKYLWSINENWWFFCILLPHTLAMYCCLKNVSNAEKAAKLILKIIKNPYLTLKDRTVNGTNATHMGYSWLIAKYVLGDADMAIKDPTYIKLQNENALDMITERGADGLHRDTSYWFHKGLPTTKYLEVLNDEYARGLYEFDTQWPHKVKTIVNRIRSITYHRDVSLGSMAIYGRNPTLRVDGVSSQSEYGIRILPFARYLRYYLPNRQFSIRLQQANMPFFEADRTKYIQGQYWAQYRNVLTSQDSDSLKFPDVGFINDSADTQLKEVDGKTMPHYPSTNSKSYVMRYKNYGLAYQEYTIPEFGKYRVYERIIVDANNQFIEIFISIQNPNDSIPITFYDTSLTGHNIGVNEEKSFLMKFNVKNNSRLTTEVTPVERPKEQFELNDNVKIVNVDRQNNILLDAGIPKVCAPYNLPIEVAVIVAPYENISYLFQFDARTNQYISID
jgi:hypothetical protein